MYLCAMKRLLFILIMLFSLSGFAQGSYEPLVLPDSLAGRLREFRKADLKRAEALEAAIFYYRDLDRIMDAQRYIQELSQLAYQLKDKYYIALSDYFYALYAMDRMDYDETLQRLRQALEIVEMLQHSERTVRLAAHLYLSQSSCYSAMGMWPESYDAIQEGLKLTAESNRDIHLKLINNLGNLYLHGGNPTEAEPLFREACKLKKSLPFRNLVSIHCENGVYDSAFIYIDSALLYSVSLYDSLSVNHFLGVTYLSKGDLDQAEHYYKECLAKTRYCHDAYLNSVIYQNSAYIAMKKQDFEQALPLIDTAIAIAETMHNVPRKLDCLRVKAVLLDLMGDLENSLNCLAEYSARRDSLLTQQKKERFLNYVHERETAVIEQRFESEKAMAKQRQRFILVIAVLVFVFTILITTALVRNRRQKELLLKQELDLRNREITSGSIDKIQSNEIVNEAIRKLGEMEEHPDKDVLPSVIRNLKTLVNDDARKDFDLHFVQIHPDFYQKLLADHPRLTQNELRLCAFIKSNLSVNEIASINGITAESVRTARKRLRKALGLTGGDISLLEFLSKY